MKDGFIEIQLHETGEDYPYRIMYVENPETVSYWHMELELIYVLEGELNAKVNGIVYRLFPGDILLIPSGDIHSLEHPGGRELVIQLDLSLLDGKYSRQHEYTDRLRRKTERLERCSRNWPCGVSKQLADIINQLEHRDISQAGDHTRHLLKTQSLIFKMAEIFYTEIPESREQINLKRMFYDRKMLQRLETALLYVKNNYAGPISLETIASITGYSVNHFTKIWLKYIGTHFHTYLNEYRVNQAAGMLRDSTAAVGEIAAACGFESYKTFCRVFKTVTGRSATEYRKASLLQK